MSTCYRAQPLPRLHRCDCLFPPPPVPPWSRTLCRPIMGDRRPAPRKLPSTANFHFAPTHNTATTGRPKSEQTPERRRVTPTSRATITGGTDLNLAGPRHLCPRPHCPRDPPAAGRSWTRWQGRLPCDGGGGFTHQGARNGAYWAPLPFAAGVRTSGKLPHA